MLCVLDGSCLRFDITGADDVGDLQLIGGTLIRANYPPIHLETTTQTVNVILINKLGLETKPAQLVYKSSSLPGDRVGKKSGKPFFLVIIIIL